MDRLEKLKLELKEKENDLEMVKENFKLYTKERNKIYKEIKSRYDIPADEWENKLISSIRIIRTMKYDLQDLISDILYIKEDIESIEEK